jgi:hypothetical protein
VSARLTGCGCPTSSSRRRLPQKRQYQSQMRRSSGTPWLYRPCRPISAISSRPFRSMYTSVSCMRASCVCAPQLQCIDHALCCMHYRASETASLFQACCLCMVRRLSLVRVLIQVLCRCCVSFGDSKRRKIAARPRLRCVKVHECTPT